eukprot:7665906-Alexandrium_andersonii.AAC.1
MWTGYNNPRLASTSGCANRGMRNPRGASRGVRSRGGTSRGPRGTACTGGSPCGRARAAPGLPELPP